MSDNEEMTPDEVRQLLSGEMSIRDWFAGQALQGLLSRPKLPSDPQTMALVAYKLADAMLAEKAGKKP